LLLATIHKNSRIESVDECVDMLSIARSTHEFTDSSSANSYNHNGFCICGEMSLGITSDTKPLGVFLTGWSFASQTARLCNLGRDSGLQQLIYLHR